MWQQITDPHYLLQFSEIIDHPAFTTHNKYVQFLKDASNELVLSIKIDLDHKIIASKELDKKLKLISYTLMSLDAEYKQVQQAADYAIVCLSWLPIKSYYVIFNLLIVLEYLVFEQEKFLKNGHKKVADIFKQALQKSDISFNKPLFNRIYNYDETKTWHIPKSANIKVASIDLETTEKEVIRKLFDYCCRDYKRRKNLSKFTKTTRLDFSKNNKISLFEFFYWYRIRFNYWDIDFIDPNITAYDLRNLYKNFYKATMNFYVALASGINFVSQKKLSRKLID